MKKKKLLNISITCVLLASFSFLGCSTDNSEQDESTEDGGTSEDEETDRENEIEDKDDQNEEDRNEEDNNDRIDDTISGSTVFREAISNMTDYRCTRVGLCEGNAYNYESEETCRISEAASNEFFLSQVTDEGLDTCWNQAMINAIACLNTSLEEECADLDSVDSPCAIHDETLEIYIDCAIAESDVRQTTGNPDIDHVLSILARIECGRNQQCPEDDLIGLPTESCENILYNNLVENHAAAPSQFIELLAECPEYGDTYARCTEANSSGVKCGTEEWQEGLCEAESLAWENCS